MYKKYLPIVFSFLHGCVSESAVSDSSSNSTTITTTYNTSTIDFGGMGGSGGDVGGNGGNTLSDTLTTSSFGQGGQGGMEFFPKFCMDDSKSYMTDNENYESYVPPNNELYEGAVVVQFGPWEEDKYVKSFTVCYSSPAPNQLLASVWAEKNNANVDFSIPGYSSFMFDNDKYYDVEHLSIDNLNCAKILFDYDFHVWKNNFLYIAAFYSSLFEAFAAAFPACDSKRSMIWYPYGCPQNPEPHYSTLINDECYSYPDVSWVFEIEFAL